MGMKRRRRRWRRRRRRRAIPRRHLSQQTRILILIDPRILFKPISVIFVTFSYIGTLLHLCLNAIKIVYVIMYVVF